MLDESIHLWMLSILKDPVVLLIRIPQIKLKQMHLVETVSIGKRTEHALYARNSFLWKPELLTTRFYQFQQMYCHRLYQAGCILCTSIRCIKCHFGIQSNLPRKITHLNDKKLGAGSIYSLQVPILPYLSGCWAVS